jgi:hypothetical protein
MASPRRRPCLVRNCAREQGPIATGVGLAKICVIHLLLSRAQRGMGPGSRGACHRARVRATRWLARDDIGGEFSDSTFQQREGAAPHSRGARRPSFASMAALDNNKRAQGRPGARCTRGLVCKVEQKKRTRAYRFSGGNPAFPAQWFYGLFRALPGDRAFLPPSPAGSFASRELDASVGAPGPHGFTVRNNSTRHSPSSRPPHPAPTFVTMANAPRAGRDGKRYRFDLGFGKTEIFLQMGLDRQEARGVADLPVGQNRLVRPTRHVSFCG